MRSYTFGPFRLEPSERRLWREDETVEIEPKAFDVLVALVERAGHLVTKDELMAAVWPDAVVEDNALTVAVSKLRAALGETARDWQYVETVPRAGYRFAPVESFDVGSEAAVPATEAHWQGAALRIGAAILVVGTVALVAVGAREGRRAGPAVVASVPLASGPTALDSGALTTPEAAYGRGRELWWTRRNSDLTLRHFRLAAVLDTSFALAYVGVADVHAMGYQTGDEARASLRRAFALDPDLGEAHATLGLVRMLQDWDWDGAAEALRRARTLAPDYAPAHQWTATLQMFRGDPEAALVSLDRALAVAPDAARPVLLADRCEALYLARRFDDAAAACLVAVESASVVPFAGRVGFWSLALAGRPADAVRWAKAHTGTPRDALRALTPLDVERADGRDRLAWHLLQRGRADDPPVALQDVARRAAYAGQRDRALRLFEEAVTTRHFHAPFLAVDPLFDDLRGDPRFRSAVREIGLEVR